MDGGLGPNKSVPPEIVRHYANTDEAARLFSGTRACFRNRRKRVSYPLWKRGELTDEQWERIRPRLPERKSQRGRPSKDDRLMFNAMLWILRTGTPWRDLPTRYGPWETVYSRFRLWKQSGVFDRLLAGLEEATDAEGRLDWELHHVDGTVVRAHQHAAGGKKGTPGRRH